MGKFALIRSDEYEEAPPDEDFSKQVLDVMIKQLGHKATDAIRMIDKALKRNESITTAEELFDEVYRSERKLNSEN